jgi:hypothetical protein
MNDEERESWVMNDEGLYDLQRTSGLGMRAWLRKNRALVDEVINNVKSGKKHQHYLKYGS